MCHYMYGKTFFGCAQCKCAIVEVMMENGQSSLTIKSLDPQFYSLGSYTDTLRCK